MSPREKLAAVRSQKMSLVYGVMAVVLFLLLIQTLLLTAALDAYLSGRADICFPAAGASGACFAITWWLMGRILEGEPDAR